MALSTTGIQAFQGSNATREVIAIYWMLGVAIKVYDDVVTDVVEYHGMPETEAQALAASLKSNNMADYRIHGPEIGDTGIWSWWITCPNAKGTKVTASCRRNGNSRMFTVTKVTETHVCSNSAGGVEY